MSACSAPWYELNLSAPDGNVSACCYYAGRRDDWLDEPIDIDHYWNGPGIKEVRRVQRGTIPSPNGCSSCFYFQQSLPGKGWHGNNYYDFSAPPLGMSELQAANWQQAKADYDSRVEEVTCSPLRLYANFGYSCNITCTMCHQVPRRGELKRQILADTVLAWPQMLERCLDVCVIGGEPFAMPEAVKFIRKFAPNNRYEDVRLTVYTNATVIHKHWNTLREKRRLWIGVSLDSIGKGFEKIRLGANWADVERNLLTALEIQSKSHPDWVITTNANVQKAGIPYLTEFAKWHVKHGIRTFFFDFISAPGVEDTYHTDNILQNPQLLDGIPDWKESFTEAASVFRSVGWESEAAHLDQYRDRVVANAEANSDRIAGMRRQRNRNDWMALLDIVGQRNLRESLVPYSPEGKPPVEIVEVGGLTGFAKTRLGDYFSTEFRRINVPQTGGKFRLRAFWPKGVPADGYTRLSHVILQNQSSAQLPDFREYLDFGFGTELSITGDLPEGTQAIRVVLTPLGEDVTLLPETLELDVDPETTVAPDVQPARSTGKFSSWAIRSVRRLKARISAGI